MVHNGPCLSITATDSKSICILNFKDTGPLIKENSLKQRLRKNLDNGQLFIVNRIKLAKFKILLKSSNTPPKMLFSVVGPTLRHAYSTVIAQIYNNGFLLRDTR